NMPDTSHPAARIFNSASRFARLQTLTVPAVLKPATTVASVSELLARATGQLYMVIKADSIKRSIWNFIDFSSKSRQLTTCAHRNGEVSRWLCPSRSGESELLRRWTPR